MLADWTIFATPAMVWMTLLGVVLVGLSKGGLGGAFGLMGVPVLSLAMPPVLAAALLLPILLMMDAVSLMSWRRYRDWSLLKTLLPAAMLGIALGWVSAAVTPDAVVRLLVGIVALAFGARAVLGRFVGAPRHRPGMGWVWGAVSGFTSFVAHAGGPPFQVHVLPMRLDPRVYTGTSVLFFAVVNAVKVVPYAALGFLDARVLVSALVMLPLAVVAVLIGAAIVRRMRAEVFYPFTYAMVTLVGLKLVWDGVSALR